MTITRPDLSYPVGVISQFMARPIEEHLQCAQRVLRYVSGTKDRGLLYWTGTAAHLVGSTDANWAGNAADRRSTSGYAFSLGSAAIAWSSKKQPTVALSSTEAEYRGAAIATCEAIWLKRLLRDLQEEASDPTTIYCDNLSNIQLAKNPVVVKIPGHKRKRSKVRLHRKGHAQRRNGSSPQCAWSVRAKQVLK